LKASDRRRRRRQKEAILLVKMRQQVKNMEQKMLVSNWW
jgi:hypothetical protein